MNVILNICIVYVITRIIVQEELFDSLRVYLYSKVYLLGYLFSCFFCLSFWVSISVCLLTNDVLCDLNHVFLYMVASNIIDKYLND